jgi:uncharacterized protein YndB with AHSA1/START domain
MNSSGGAFPTIRIERRFDAASHQVYRAWLDPQMLRRWLTPGVAVSSVEVQEREGGRFIVRHTDGTSDIGGFQSEILELIEDRRIVFRWGFTGPDGSIGPVFDSLLTISLRAVDDNATVLTLVHEHLDTLHEALPAVADNVRGGWLMVFDILDRVLQDSETAISSTETRT